MTPLIVLLTAFIILLFDIQGRYKFVISGRIAMSAMLVFTAIGHVVYTDGMAMMIPDLIPYKKEIVYFTGAFEIAAAIGLHIPRLRVLIGWLLILFFLIIIPANIKASIDHVDFQKATFVGNGLNYLWVRIPLQALFIAWAYLCAIKASGTESILSKLNN